MDGKNLAVPYKETGLVPETGEAEIAIYAADDGSQTGLYLRLSANGDSLRLAEGATMSDLCIQYNEEMVGAGHPTKSDTLNRLFLGGVTPTYRDSDGKVLGNIFKLQTIPPETAEGEVALFCQTTPMESRAFFAQGIQRRGGGGKRRHGHRKGPARRSLL